MVGSPVEESALERVAGSLVNAIVDCKALSELLTQRVGTDETFPVDGIQQALLRTNAVRNFDMAFRRITEARHHGEAIRFELSRSNTWKVLLADDNVPLNFWPAVLAKADAWKHQTSHSHLDALFYLVREKNDVLLQNVRKRRIRKRKRFQLSS